MKVPGEKGSMKHACTGTYMYSYPHVPVHMECMTMQGAATYYCPPIPTFSSNTCTCTCMQRCNHVGGAASLVESGKPPVKRSRFKEQKERAKVRPYL